MMVRSPSAGGRLRLGCPVALTQAPVPLDFDRVSDAARQPGRGAFSRSWEVLAMTDVNPSRDDGSDIDAFLARIQAGDEAAARSS